MLPDLDGFEVQKRLVDRGRPSPVLFLTARDATEDKVRGLTIGGDDYVTKPFSLEELIARIRAVLRRAHGAGPPADRLAFADLEMDEDTHEVWRRGRGIDLTPTEFSLLRFLLANPDESCRRTRSWTTCGTTTSEATPRSWRPTSATCGRRLIPRSLGLSIRCGAWGTSFASPRSEPCRSGRVC